MATPELWDIPYAEEGIRGLILENDALRTASLATLGQVELGLAKEAAKEALRLRPPSETVTEYVVGAGIHQVAGVPFGEPPIQHPVDATEAELLGLAWMGWIRGDLEAAKNLLVLAAKSDRSDSLMDLELPLSQDGMAQRAHFEWATALGYLLHDQTASARKFWNRAIEVASLFGLDSTGMIRWTYAATFLDTKKASDPS